MSASAGHARWPLWSTYAYLAVDRPALLPRAREIADGLLDGVERAVSRFRPDSDLNRANGRAGSWTRVDPLLVAAAHAGLRAAELTEGLVDPCLGHRLVSIGYDADLEVVRGRGPRPWGPPPPRPKPEAWRGLEIGEDALRVPAGSALDLGATAKAWAADVVAGTVASSLGCAVVVSLGGDVSVAGPPGAPAAAWPVRVTETPDEDGPAPVVLVSGGLATSSTLVRRWRGPTGQVVHHVVDPRTGLPATEVFRTVTCAGADALRANIASTAALVLGADAPGWLADRGVTSRLVAADGDVVTVGAWPAYEPGRPAHHDGGTS